MVTIPLYLFDTTSSEFDELADVSSKATDDDKGRKIRCRICEHIITNESQLVAVNGSQSHSRINPGGHQFQFECFRNAPGCSVMGNPSNEYTWFPGYTWQVAVCTGCGEHLGWMFKGESPFYGLISNRLIRDADRLD